MSDEAEDEKHVVEVPLLLGQEDFIESYVAFHTLITEESPTAIVDEHIVTLFLAWFENTKDQRALSMQERAMLKEETDDDEPWKRGEPPF